MTKNNPSNKNSGQSAVQVLQQQADQMVDELNVADNSKEKREEILTNISETIKNTLKKLKVDGQKLEDLVFEEKISLLERTKIAVEAFLVQLLSSPNASGKAYEALSMIIKVNAELIKGIEDGMQTQAGKDGKGWMKEDNQKNGNMIVIAPSEAMLEGLIQKRHANKKVEKNVNKNVDEDDGDNNPG